MRGQIEELREALADFLNDDFESDRFKRMLYTFSLKIAGTVKQFDESLRRDLQGVVEGDQINSTVLRGSTITHTVVMTLAFSRRLARVHPYTTASIYPSISPSLQARLAVIKKVENLMGVDVESSDGPVKKWDTDELDHHLGEVIVYKVRMIQFLCSVHFE